MPLIVLSTVFTGDLLKVYKLGRAKHSKQWPSTGSLYSNGRWHRKGQFIVYTSESISLAKLEVLANSETFPVDYVLYEITINPAVSIYHVPKKELPKNWQKIPCPAENWQMIDSLLQNYGCIKVPSAITPSEYNFLLNGRYPKFNKVFKMKMKKINLGPRLW